MATRTDWIDRIDRIDQGTGMTGTAKRTEIESMSGFLGTTTYASMTWDDTSIQRTGTWSRLDHPIAQDEGTEHDPKGHNLSNESDEVTVDCRPER